jgi:hypothetical protein
MRLGESYPLSPMAMFARPKTSSARIVARIGDDLREVGTIREWDCDLDALEQVAASAGAQGQLARRHILEHGGAGTQPVMLVELRFTIDPASRKIVTKEQDRLGCRGLEEEGAP